YIFLDCSFSHLDLLVLHSFPTRRSSDLVQPNQATYQKRQKFKIAEGQWYRYAPSYVSPAYHLLEGFPFIQEPPSGDLQERVLIRSEERFSRNAETDLVCRLLLEKKKERS